MTQASRLATCKYSEDAKKRQVGEECEKLILEWAEKALIVWCKVREDRPEVTISRDSKSGLSWFKDKKVSLLGCGAIGSYVAECLVRTGVEKLTLYDNGKVAPGLLVRQLYDDSDIGKHKAEALANRLHRIYPAKTKLSFDTNDILDIPLEPEKFDQEVDILIDTTGNESVSKKLELVRREIGSSPHLASLCIDHNAMRAKAVLSLSGHSGGPLDVNRATKLMLANQNLTDYLEEFWPVERRQPFQPEPGCSDLTFVGSSADMAALSGLMLNSIAMSLTQESENSAFAFLFTQQQRDNNGYLNFKWKRDIVLQDPHADFEIRLESNAWREIEGWCKTSKRCLGDRVETGGLLFGEVDELLKIIWVAEASGPPVDSTQSEEQFICGIKGVDELEDEKRERTRGSVRFVGMWHSHPYGMPLPSSDDYEGMQQLVVGRHNTANGSFLLIVGTPYVMPTLGSYYFKKEDFGQQIHIRDCEFKELPLIKIDNNIGIALSGGGSRAIAFHLGCLRALHDRGVLDQAKVISAVSGGSVIAAMYAFSQDSFESFEKRVVELLRRGIQGDIIKQCLTPKNLSASLGTLALSGSAAVLSRFSGLLLKKQFTPPLRRWRSRTTAFEDVLHSRLFGDSFLGDQTRNDIDIVINATELRTGSAFRFGSKESGCWRFGKLSNNKIPVAKAVAASAAYPALLPAIDEKYTFVDRKGIETKKRAILTDGGVYDNLGISCLDPDKSTDYSFNVFKPKYIICCSAGQGIFQDNVIPYFALDRMIRSFNSVFRKSQDSGYAKLHQLVESGKLKGFILPYLGQLDHNLPLIPPDLVRREQVFDYPTDFSAMDDDTIQLLSKRGEQLTRLLIERYTPEL